MKIKILLTTIVTIMIFVSCEKKSNTAVLVELVADIIYSDENGNDLLDVVQYPKSINTDDIRISLLIDGIEENIVPSSGSDYPSSFFIYYRDDIKKNVMRVFANIPDDKSGFEGEIDVIHLLKLSENDTDTLTFRIEKSSGNTIARKIWYNDELRYVDDSVSEPLFEVIK